MGEPPSWFDKSRSDKAGVVVLIAVLVIVNLWYDVYHRLGFIFDAIIGPFFIIKYLREWTNVVGGFIAAFPIGVTDDRECSIS